MPRAVSALVSLALAGLSACQGEILGGSPGPGSSSGGAAVGPTGGGGAGVLVPAGTSAGPRPLRRLTVVEYENTVTELLGLTEHFESALPDDARGDSGFLRAGPVGEVDAEHLQQTAEQLAELAIARGLPALLGCSPEGAEEQTCLQQFIRSFGRRAFRRPLSEAEQAELLSLYQTARATHGLPAPEAVGLALSAMLQAPQFLYLWERTVADDAAAALVPLNPHELASRLSYLLWRTMPDAMLSEAADSGELAAPGALMQHARRLLQDPRARSSLVEFVRGWFHLPARTNDELSRSASDETALFVESILASGGSLESLLTSPDHFVNATLAPLYGVSGIEGSELRPAQVDPAQRFGLLTQVAFLGTNADGPQSHPVKRGHVILKQLLCQELPALPDEVPQPGPQREGVSNRERFSVHGQNACAQGCHRLLDPLGFAFEHYDGTGRYRTLDAGQPVDASGSVELLTGTTLQFRDASELVQQLATSAEARSCAVKQTLRLALDRREVTADEASVAALESAFSASAYDLRELFAAVVAAPSFTHRAPAQ